MLGSDPEDDLLTDVGGERRTLLRRHCEADPAESCLKPALPRRYHGVDEIHLRRADKARHKGVRRLVIELLRRVILPDNALVHHHYPVRHGHGLGLIVGNVDKGGLELLMQQGYLAPHLGAELCVKVRERLVEQEHLGISHHSSAESHSLPLPAREGAGSAVEVRRDIEDIRSPAHLLVYLLFRQLFELQRKRHILIDRHVRVERIALKNHCDVPVLGGDVVHPALVDIQLARGYLLKPRYHAERCGFAAAGRADEHHEFLILYLKRQVRYDRHLAVIKGFNNVFEYDCRHKRYLLSLNCACHHAFNNIFLTEKIKNDYRQY